MHNLIIGVNYLIVNKDYGSDSLTTEGIQEIFYFKKFEIEEGTKIFR